MTSHIEHSFNSKIGDYNKENHPQQKTHTVSNPENILFFDMLETDCVLKLFIETFQIADQTGDISKRCANFKHPPLKNKTIEAIEKLFSTTILVPPIHSNLNLPTIPFSPLKALQRQKEKFEKDNNRKEFIAKFCGSKLRYLLGEKTVLSVLEALVAHYRLEIDPKKLLTTSFKERLKIQGKDKDIDVHSTLLGASLEECMVIADILFDELQSNAPNQEQFNAFILKERKDLLVDYSISDLIKNLIEEEYLDKKPQNGYQNSKDGEKDIYSNRCLANFDFSYFASQTRKSGLTSVEALGIDITPLLEGKQQLLPPFDPHPKGNVLQYYLDHNHDLYRMREETTIGKKDFLRILKLMLEGKRCWVKGTNQKALESLIRTITCQKGDLVSELVSVIQKGIDLDLDQSVGLTYLFLSALSEQEKINKSTLQEVQKGILFHLKSEEKTKGAQCLNPFLEEIKLALQNRDLNFEEVASMIHLLGYIGLNTPELVPSTIKVVLTSHDQTPHLQIHFYHQNHIHLHLLVRYEPDQALHRILAIDNPCTISHLNRLFQALIPSYSRLNGDLFSPIRKYRQSSVIKLKEVEQLAQQLAAHTNETENLWGYWVIFSCLKQEFSFESLSFFLKSSRSSACLQGELLRSSFIQSLNILYHQYQKEVSFLSSIDHSQLIQLLIDLIKLKKEPQNFFAQDLYAQLGTELLNEVTVVAHDRDSSLLVELTHPSLSSLSQAIEFSMKLQASENLSPSIKLHFLLQLTHACCETTEVKQMAKIASLLCDLLQQKEIDHSLILKDTFFSQKKIKFLIQQLYQEEVKIAYDLWKLGLEKSFILIEASTAKLGLKIAQYFLHHSFSGMILANSCWALLKKYHLDSFISQEESEQFIQDFQKNIDQLNSTQKKQLQNSFLKEGEILEEKYHYTLYLDTFHNHLSLQSQKNFAILFDSFITILSPKKTEKQWEKESLLILLLFSNFLKDNQKDSISEEQFVILKKFLNQINNHYQQTPYHQRLIQKFLEKYIELFKPHSLTPVELVNTLTSIPLFYEVFFHPSVDPSKENIHQFFELIQFILKPYQSTSLPLHIERLCKKLSLGNFLEQLKKRNLAITTLHFFASLASHQVLVQDPSHLQILLEMMEIASQEETLDGNLLEELLTHYSIHFEQVSHQCQQSLKIILEKQLQLILQNQAYEKLLPWLMSRKKLNLESKVFYPFEGHLQAATTLIKQNSPFGFHLLRFIPKNISLSEEIKDKWTILLNSLSEHSSPLDCAKVLIDYSELDHLTLQHSALIKKIIRKLLKKPLGKKKSRKEVLNLSLLLLEKFSILDHEIWTILLSKIKEDHRNLNPDVIHQLSQCLISHQYKIDFKENSAKCWALIFHILSLEGHSSLFELVQPLDLKNLYQGKSADRIALRSSAYQALAKGVLRSVKNEEEATKKSFIQFLNQKNGKMIFMWMLKYSRDPSLKYEFGEVFNHFLKGQDSIITESISSETILPFIELIQEIDLKLVKEKEKTICDHIIVILSLSRINKISFTETNKLLILKSLKILFLNDFKICLQEDIKAAFADLIQLSIEKQDLKTLLFLKQFGETHNTFDKKTLVDLDRRIDQLSFWVPSIPQLTYFESFRNQMLEMRHIQRQMIYLKESTEENSYQQLVIRKKTLKLNFCRQGCAMIALISGVAIVVLKDHFSS